MMYQLDNLVCIEMYICPLLIRCDNC